MEPGREIFPSQSNWGRWGESDTRGTLNLITSKVLLRAVRLVREGVVVSCSRPLDEHSHGPDARPGVDEFIYDLVEDGSGAGESGPAIAVDRFAVACHGYQQTHLDSHAHVFWDGRMYNGRTPDAPGDGVGAAATGILGRGVLVDAPALQGRNYLQRGKAITPNDLHKWFEFAKLEPRPGDILFVRTGRDAWEAAGDNYHRATGLPGLSQSSLSWFSVNDTAVLVSDVAQGVAPPESAIPEPIHFVGSVTMGMWLVDNADLGALSRACQERERWEFLAILVPLALPGATGSPINPLAVF